MSNPLINVISALYGAPGKVIDVTKAAQSIFDGQLTGNPDPYTLQQVTLTGIGSALFDIDYDPAPGVIKVFTIAYSLPVLGPDADVLMRGAQDGQTLTLTVAPVNTAGVAQAIYATNDMGLDVTDKVNAWRRDPENALNNFALTISSQPFFDAFTGGSDPAPGVTKYFSVIWPSEYTAAINVCGYDNQTVNIV